MLLISKKELKNIVNKIIEEENKNHSINIKAYPFTKTEVMRKNKNDLDKDSNKYPILKVIERFYWNFRAVNISDKKEQNIFIAIDCYDNLFKVHSNQFLIEFYFTIYHEIRHSLQNLGASMSEYMKDILKIEDILIYFNYNYYIANKSQFKIELDANNYALEKTKILFSQKKYVKFFEQKKRFLQSVLKRYDFDKNFEELSKIVLKRPILTNDEFLSIFFNEDGSCKNLEQIIGDIKFQKKNNLFQIDIINYYNEDIINLDSNSKEYIFNLIKEIDLNEIEYINSDAILKVKNIIHILNGVKVAKKKFSNKRVNI